MNSLAISRNLKQCRVAALTLPVYQAGLTGAEQEGRGNINPGRAIAIYIAQKIAGYRLNEIASLFGITRCASVPEMVARYQNAVPIDIALANTIEDIVKTKKQKVTTRALMGGLFRKTP